MSKMRSLKRVVSFKFNFLKFKFDIKLGVEFADGDGYDETIENMDQQGGITLQEAGGSGNGDRLVF